MLRKLLKHEVRTLSGTFLPLVLILFGMTVLANLASLLKDVNQPLAAFATAIFVLYCIVAFCVLFGFFCAVLIRFYRSMITSEGYLTFTLPVTVSQLIISKLLVSFLFLLGGIIVVFASVQLTVYAFFDLDIWANIPKLFATFGAEGTTVFLLFVGVLIATILGQLLYCFLGMAIGQQFAINKIIGSIIGYFMVYFCIQFLLLIIIGVGVVCVGITDLEEFMNTVTGLYTIFLGEAGLVLLTGAACFRLSVKMFRTKLNLD